jgi:hypothetical protein
MCSEMLLLYPAIPAPPGLVMRRLIHCSPLSDSPAPVCRPSPEAVIRPLSAVAEKGVFEKRENDGINSSDMCLTCWMCFPTVRKRSKDATSGELTPSFFRT